MKNRFARFAIVGFIGVVAQLCFLTVFTNRFRFAPVPATAFAVELTILHNFLWHEHFTWSDRTSTQRLLRLWRFHLSNGGISLLGNTLLTYCFVTRLHARQVPSALAAIALCSLANFIFADRWVFPTPTTSSKACASSSVPQCGLRQSLRFEVPTRRR
jgi:putative flippase GtrA